MAKIIKRNGTEVPFDGNKIVEAIKKANKEVSEENRLPESTIRQIACDIEKICTERDRPTDIEEIQDLVQKGILVAGAYEMAIKYITYRYKHELLRKSNTTDEQIMSLLRDSNEEVKSENANKNPTLASTQRDYVAGTVSRDITDRFLLPEDVVRAHREGIIHFHDSDFFIQKIHNCCLVNLEDMLQNGTVINDTMIEKPHSFSTACNIATQVIALVASNQYGGQTISLAHLAPFVDVSRQRLKKDIRAELKMTGNPVDEAVLGRITEERVRKEITRGVQMLQYQILTLLTTNGQTPFVSFAMYLNEAKTETEKLDLAMIIEEVLKQRIQGVKNKKGVWITPSFPKLLYFIEDDNCEAGTPYWWLTELAAKCSAKRLVPDYISEKIMMRDKINPKTGKGEAYPCMGLVTLAHVKLFELCSQV